MGNRRRIKVGVDTLPITASSGNAPAGAPYLLNGPDVSGDLTAAVDVLALATPQPFIATAPIAGDIGLPITLAYDNGAGAVGTGAGLQFKAQNDLDTTKDICTVIARLTDATDTSEDSEVDIQVLAAGADQTALTIANGGLLLGGTGAKTITASTGGLTVSASAVSMQGATASASVNPSAGVGFQVQCSGTIAIDSSAGATVDIGASASGSILNLYGDEFVIIETAVGGAGGVQINAGAIPTWQFRDSASLTGELVALGSARPISNVSPATTTGGVVVWQQLFDAGQAAPTNGGATVPIVPGAEFIATATFTAPTGGPGTFLLQNNTGRAITIIGARAVIPAAGANTLALTIDNAGGTDLFTVAALAATGGTHVPAATTYTLAQAVIANGANIIVTAEGSGATIDTILFLEFIVQ